MTRAPRKSRNNESPRLSFTLVCRCFCSAFRELIWSQHRPRTSAYVPRCAGTTARTCAPGNPLPLAKETKEACKWTAIHLELRRDDLFQDHRAAELLPVIPDTHAFAYAPRSRQEARRPREPLLPLLPPPKGRLKLSPHGSDWLKRFLATSSVPVSPESIASSKWFARGESRPAEVCDRGALREEPPSYRRPRYLSPWQAGSLEAIQ